MTRHSRIHEIENTEIFTVYQERERDLSSSNI